ncbi:MAG: type II toxin-antitoxin system VapC family toxin, partial [Bacteroidota bacterium]
MKRILLDSHMLIWAARSPSALSKLASDIINDPDNNLWVSMISLWEIAIKKSIGKLDIDSRILDIEMLDKHGYLVLPVEIEHIRNIVDLPRHHGDP